jgi:uncharacterized protein (DUF488 family)
MPQPFFTIGHSTRSVPEFVELLRPAEVRLVVDVRTVPRSRANPQFNRDVLPESLAEFQIAYEHIAELGAERRTAIMCAEAVWWRCHRRIIADYLMAAGEAVFHILAPGKIEEARMTPAARPAPGRGLIYPPAEAPR